MEWFWVQKICYFYLGLCKELLSFIPFAILMGVDLRPVVSSYLCVLCVFLCVYLEDTCTGRVWRAEGDDVYNSLSLHYKVSKFLMIFEKVQVVFRACQGTRHSSSTALSWV